MEVKNIPARVDALTDGDKLVTISASGDVRNATFAQVKSLIPAGTKGDTGASGADGSDGADGKSAYQIWLDAGNTGSEDDFLASLKGETGATGPQGAPGTGGNTTIRSLSESGGEAAGDSLILVDTTAGDITITLLAVSDASGSVRVKKVSDDANVVNVKGSGSELIDEANQQTIHNYMDCIEIAHGATQHYITAQFIR